MSNEDVHADEPVLPPVEEHLPPLDFTTFVLSLSTSALASMGELPAEHDHGHALDLGLARHTIDLLGMLEVKTKGNLTGQEERLLHRVHLDLRLRYVDVVKRHASTATATPTAVKPSR